MKLLAPAWHLPLLALVSTAFSPVLSSTVKAQQTIVSYTFAGTTGTPTSTAAGVSASEFVRDGADNTFYDNTAGNPAPDTNSGAWTTAATLDLALYDTFTVTPGAGGARWNALTFDLANFDAAGINDGPAAFAVRSSVDGFTATLLSGTVNQAFTRDTVSLNVTATTPVEYRIYGFAAGSTGGLLQIDNVALTFTAVPEPAVAPTLLAAGALMGLCFLRRKTRPGV